MGALDEFLFLESRLGPLVPIGLCAKLTNYSNQRISQLVANKKVVCIKTFGVPLVPLTQVLMHKGKKFDGS